MAYYLKESKDVLRELSTTENGLSSSEAASRLEKHGKNKLDQGKTDSTFK